MSAKSNHMGISYKYIDSLVFYLRNQKKKTIQKYHTLFLNRNYLSIRKKTKVI